MIGNLVKRDFAKVTPETKLSKIIGKLAENEEAVAVFDGNNFLGLISANNLIERDYPSDTKAKSLIRKNVPKIDESTDIINASKLLLENDLKALPVFSGGKIKGLLYEKDLIKNCKEYVEKSGKAIKDIIHAPITIEKSETVGKARTVVRENDISRLPVVDENGYLVGIVDTKDFLKTITPNEGMGIKDLAGESLPEYEYPITTISDPSPLTVDSLNSWKDAIELMKKHNKSYVLILRDKKPVGIITPKDILEVIASLEEQEKVYVQITGLDNIENLFDREKIDKMIEDFIKKIGKIYNRIEYMFVHIKSSQNKGGDRLYSVRNRILTPVGLYVSKASGWNAIATVNETLDKLEKQIIKEHQKSKDLRSPRGA